MTFVFKNIMQPSNLPTFNLGLIGYPLGHSRSPELHRGFLAECGLSGDYALYPIPPDDMDALKALLDRVRTGEIQGLNVTIPHKQNVIPLLDELSETASTIGAVNTIYAQKGKLIGENTDAEGFWRDLQHLIRENSRPKALVLGAGGSARAVTYALLQHGWDVTLTSRRHEQAENLARDYGKETHASPFTLQALAPLLPALSLIVNTTPVGMSPHPHASPWLADLPFPPKAALYDLIYNPAETQLMQDAKKAGLPVRGGMGMLVGQARRSFEIWTGCLLDSPQSTRRTPSF